MLAFVSTITTSNVSQEREEVDYENEMAQEKRCFSGNKGCKGVIEDSPGQLWVLAVC